MNPRARLVGFVGVVALLTAAAVALNTAVQRMQVRWLGLIFFVLVFVLPGTVYVRLHPMWRSRAGSPRAVAGATALGVLVGLLSVEMVLRVLRAVGAVSWSPSSKHVIGVIALAVIAPTMTFIVATDTYQKAQARSEGSERDRETG